VCPAGLALEHPAADILHHFTKHECPTNTGRPWTTSEVEEAVAIGPHVSLLDSEAMKQLQMEVEQKADRGQCRVVLWDDIKHNPPEHLKMWRIAMIPHKSREFRAILDLSFAIKLANGGVIPSVNGTSEKTAPKGTIDQLGHSLMRVIHAFTILIVLREKNGTLRMCFPRRRDSQ